MIDKDTDEISVIVTEQRRKNGPSWELPKGGVKPEDHTLTDTSEGEFRDETGVFFYDDWKQLVGLPAEVHKGLISNTWFFYTMTLNATLSGRR